MNSVLKVTKFEIVRQLKKPAFWAAILLMPLIIVVVFLIGMAAGGSGPDANPKLDAETVVAITDEAGILPEGNPYTTICDTKEVCLDKIKSGEVNLYYYIPADFQESKRAEFYHVSEGIDLFNNDAAILKGILSEASAQKVSAVDAIILSGGYEIKDNKLTASGENANALGKAVIPLAILVVYFIFVALFGNRFLMAVVEEKENRISEMILTTVSAKHLIVGKILAMLALAVIQIVVFIVPALILLIANRENPVVATIVSTIEIDPVTILMNITLFIASVFLYAGTCVFVGSLVSTARDASSFVGPAIIAMVLPLYFMQLFLAAEPNFLVYFFSYFPLSAPIALMLRSGLGTLSAAEFVAGLAVVTIFAVIMTRLAIVTFQRNAINFERAKLKDAIKWKKSA